MSELNTPAALVVWGGFVLAFLFGAIANKTNFCTMGAISDIVNMEHWGRMRMWLLTIAIAVLGANLLYYVGWIDLSKSVYQRPILPWLSLLLGGFLFGGGDCSLFAMLQGDYVTEKRMLLSVSVMRKNVEVSHAIAFNEMVVHRSNIGSMIECEVRIDGEYLYTQRADGLIVCTPTGSTAYALSSGGPIVHPALDVMTLVPVCPHTLSNRPIVVSGASQIEILMHRTGDVHVRFDSHTHFDLQVHDRLIVARHDQPVHLLHPVGHSYYHTLREKLLWNKSL
jgi:hypothetical protein